MRRDEWTLGACLAAQRWGPSDAKRNPICFLRHNEMRRRAMQMDPERGIPTDGWPEDGVADSLDETKAAFRAAWDARVGGFPQSGLYRITALPNMRSRVEGPSRFTRNTMRSPWSAQRSLPLTGNRALSLLADNPDGCAVPVMLAHGFSIVLLNQLIRAGLVSARTKPPDKREVYRDRLVHMEITDAGRRVLVDSDQLALTDARPKPRVADNLDDGPAPLGP
jgi:hypothetical protein